MTGKIWGLVAFVVVLAVIVVGGLLMPPAAQNSSSTSLSDDDQAQVDALIAKARELKIGEPESAVIAKLGEPRTKSQTRDDLQTWGYKDLTVAIYKGKICGIQGCGLIPRGELVPAELQVKEESNKKASNSEGGPSPMDRIPGGPGH